MRFCSTCGKELTRFIPDGDERERLVCPNCATIHYQNPRVVVGCLPVWEDRVLLCRRAIAPRAGFWTLPAGFMEIGESTLEGARRETWEESRARAIECTLYGLFDLPHINQVYVFYRAKLEDARFAPGPESTDVALFSEVEVPWQDIAFPVVTATLKSFFADRRLGTYPVRHSELRLDDWNRFCAGKETFQYSGQKRPMPGQRG